MVRLFVALRPPPEVRSLLADAMDGVPGARWQSDEQLHVTLRFIGEVSGHVAEDVAAALANIHASAPQVRIAGVGSFGQRGRADTLWAGLTPEAPLAHLHRKVDQACVRAGLEPERRAYRPHVTLARMPRSIGGDPAVGRWLGEHAALASDGFTLPHLILYQSHLGRAGAHYEPVARWPLDRTGNGET